MASAAADPSSIDAPKRPVWNVPSNGSSEVGTIMDGVSWPALSDAAKASSKSSSSDSLKSLSDASSPAAQGISQAPLISSPTAKHTTSSPNPNSVQNPMPPVRQKSVKRGGSGSGAGSGTSSPSNGGPAPPQQLAVSTDNAHNAPDKQVVPEPSPGVPKTAGGPTFPHHGGPDQHRNYGGNRRGNNGSGPHQNHGNRRDQDWSHPRGSLMQQGRGAIRPYGPYPRPLPPVSAPYIVPTSPVRPYIGNAMSFHDMHPHMYFVGPHLPPPEALRGMTFAPQPIPHPMFVPAMDPQRAQLLAQIEYYFSPENLWKDRYLRQKMDERGWVPISLIAGFNRVKLLTNNIQYILDTVRLSTQVEVQGEKIRSRNDWMNWLVHPPNHFGNTSGPHSPKTPDYDSVTTNLQNVNLEGATTNNDRMGGPTRAGSVFTRSASGNLNNQVSGNPNEEGNGNLPVFGGSDRSKSSGSLPRSDSL